MRSAERAIKILINTDFPSDLTPLTIIVGGGGQRNIGGVGSSQKDLSFTPAQDKNPYHITFHIAYKESAICTSMLQTLHAAYPGNETPLIPQAVYQLHTCFLVHM